MFQRSRLIFFLLMLVRSLYSIPNSTHEKNPLIDSLEFALKMAKHDTSKVKILSELTEVCDLAQITTYAEPLIKLCELKLETKNDPLNNFYLKYYSDALTNIGYYLKQKGEITEALNYYEKSLAIKKTIGDKPGTSMVLNNIAMIYNNQGNIEKSLKYHFQSLKMQEELNNKSGISNSLNNIGGIYDNQGDVTKALEYYKKSLKIREELHDMEGIATSLTNIGFIYLTLGDTNTALDYCNKTLKIHEQNNNLRGLAYSINNLGFIYLNKGEIEKAEEFYTKSLKIRESIGDKQGIAYSNNNLAEIYSRQKKYDKAIVFAGVSLKISRELGYPNIIRDAALSLKNSYEKLNKPAEALKMYELYIQMRDSINNIETRKTSLKTQFKYEFDKKEAILKEQQIKESLLADEKNQRQKIIIWATSIGILLLILFLVFIINRLHITNKQKIIIEEQKHLVDEKQKEILDSINYARRIQYALLASDTLLREHLPEHFVLFKPKDVVSGDFYWAAPIDEDFIYITADCTGHGVPGAFMSLLNISKLSQTINENKITRPELILNTVRTEIIKALNPKDSNEESKDGMDAIVCKINLKKRKLEYAAANNSFYIVRNNVLINCAADKMPVGKGQNDLLSFKNYELDLQTGDMIYTLTDGYADQFGGEKGKKFKYKQLENFLLAIHKEPMQKQHELLETTFKSWKGSLEQVDDICIIGLRVV